ncbi:MAG: hypothetical protein WCA13_18190 [Terriglobales bacterium]
MVRRLTVETVCFETLLGSVFTGFAVWIWGMLRKSFGAIPAVLWIVLTCISLACAAIVGVLEFTR